MSTTTEPRLDSYRSWGLLDVLFIGYVGVYLCRKNVAVAVPLLREDFHLTREEVGRIASAGTFAYALGKMILCPLVDRWGGRSGFLGALIGVTVFSLCGALAPSWGALTLIYAFNRFCGAAAWASMVKQAPPWFGEKNHGLVLGVLSLSYVFGGAAGIACAGQISEWTGHSWRAIFGLPSFALLFIIGLAA